MAKYQQRGGPAGAGMRQHLDIESGGYDSDEGQHAMGQPMPLEIRAAFIRKVYGILAAQVAFTVLFCAACMYIEPVRNGIIGMYAGNPYLSLILFIPTICILCALQKHKSEYPLNYQLLLAFTVLMSLPIGFICAAYYQAGVGFIIIQAALITIGVFGVLTLYTFVSGKDFSFMGAGLSAGLGCLMLWSFFSWLFGFPTGFLFSLFGALLFCGFIVYDTFRVIKVLGVDDAILGAIELYLDILNLFLFILQMLSAGNQDDG